MTPSVGLAALIEKIESDPTLLESLQREKSADAFAAACARAAEALGLQVEAGEVFTLIQQRALVWQQRHIL